MMPGLAFATDGSVSGSVDSSETPAPTYADKSFVLDLTNEAGYTGKDESVTIKIGDKVIATSSSVVPAPTPPTVPTDGEDTSTVLRTTAVGGPGTTVTEGEISPTPSAPITDDAFAALFETNTDYKIVWEQDTKLSVTPLKEDAVIPNIDQNATRFTIEGLAEGSAMPADTEVVPLMGQFKLVGEDLDDYKTDKYGIMAYKVLDSFNEHNPKMYNIIGYHGDSWKKTTFGGTYGNGYNVYLRTPKTTSESGDEDPYDYNDSNNNLTVTPSFEFVNNGKLLMVTYTVTNSDSENAKDFALGVSADIMIGKDDCAPIEEFADGRGFKMTSTKEGDKEAQFNFFGKTTTGVTNVTGYSYEQCGYYYTKANAFDITSRVSIYDNENNENDRSGVSYVDSGMAYSWHDQTLAANSNETYSIAIGIGGLGSEEAGGGTTEPTDPTPPVYISEPDDEIDIDLDDSGNGEAVIKEENIENILADQLEDGIEAKDAVVILNVKTSGTVTEGGKITVNLPLTVQNELLDKEVKEFGLNVEDLGIYLTLDNKAIENANKKAKGDIDINIAKKEDIKLSTEAAKLIGERTLVDINLSYGSNQKVENLGDGKSTIKFKYDLKSGENSKAIVVAYIDSKGEAKKLNTTYDAKTNVATATTNHFSIYGVGYVTPPTKVSILRTANDKGRASLRWSRATNDPEGYRVYRSATKDGKYKHIATIKNGKAKTYKEKAFKSNKTYYYKVRAYKQANGKAIWGGYSPIKVVKF